MTRMTRRWFTSGMAALALGIVGGRGLQPEPARASKRKPIKYDISTSEFRSTCTQGEANLPIGATGRPPATWMVGR